MLKWPSASTSHSPPTLKPAAWTRSFTSRMLSDFPSAACTRTRPLASSADTSNTPSIRLIDSSTPRVHRTQVMPLTGTVRAVIAPGGAAGGAGAPRATGVGESAASRTARAAAMRGGFCGILIGIACRPWARPRRDNKSPGRGRQGDPGDVLAKSPADRRERLAPARPTVTVQPLPPLWAIPVSLALVLLAAAAFRAVYFYLYARNSIFFDGLILDSSVYDSWARSIVAGDWIGRKEFYFPPLYPYLLALVFRTFGHTLAIVYLLQAGHGAAGAAVRRLPGDPAGARRGGAARRDGPGHGAGGGAQPVRRGGFPAAVGAGRDHLLPGEQSERGGDVQRGARLHGLAGEPGARGGVDRRAGDRTDHEAIGDQRALLQEGARLHRVLPGRLGGPRGAQARGAPRRL